MQVGRKKQKALKNYSNPQLFQDAYSPPVIGRVNVFPAIDPVELKEQREETAQIKAVNIRAAKSARKVRNNMGGENRAYGDADVLHKKQMTEFLISNLFSKFGGKNFQDQYAAHQNARFFTNQYPETANAEDIFHKLNEPQDIPNEYPYEEEPEEQEPEIQPITEEELQFYRDLINEDKERNREKKREMEAQKREAYIQLLEKHYASVKTGARGRPKFTPAQEAQAARQKVDRAGMAAEDPYTISKKQIKEMNKKAKSPSVMSDTMTDRESVLSNLFR
jgi:hypothetical protein